MSEPCALRSRRVILSAAVALAGISTDCGNGRGPDWPTVRPMNPLSVSNVFLPVTIMSVTFLTEVGLFILIGML